MKLLTGIEGLNAIGSVRGDLTDLAHDVRPYRAVIHPRPEPPSAVRMVNVHGVQTAGYLRRPMQHLRRQLALAVPAGLASALLGTTLSVFPGLSALPLSPPT